VTHAVDLPALDGRDPLGFLAALGVLRLLTDHDDAPARLSFDPETAVARIHGRHRSVEDVIASLCAIVWAIPVDGAVPGVPAHFPLAKEGTGKCPMRVRREDYRALAARFAGDPLTARWLGSLVTDLAIDGEGRSALTPLTAPAGQQALRTFFDKPLERVRAEPHRLLTEALTGWRRVPGYTGEQLDHRAIRTAADDQSGEAIQAGVPGATWLAIMAIPLLRLTGTGTRPQSTLWHGHDRRRVMLWPLWTPPLDTHAVTTLLEHPALIPTNQANTPTIRAEAVRPLGVFCVAAATRTRTANAAGYLTPTYVALTEPASR